MKQNKRNQIEIKKHAEQLIVDCLCKHGLDNVDYTVSLRPDGFFIECISTPDCPTELTSKSPSDYTPSGTDKTVLLG